MPTHAHCSSCGLPLVGASCPACGGSSAPLPLSDGDPAAGTAYAAAGDSARLAAALAAWDAGDAAALIGECLKAAGADDVTPGHRGGSTNVRGMLGPFAVFVETSPTGELVIESPVARLPLTQYVPALRLLAEFSDRDATAVRFSVRGDLVLARHVGKIAATPPQVLTALIEAVQSAALEAARILVGALQARTIAAAEQTALSSATGAARVATPTPAVIQRSALDDFDEVDARRTPGAGDTAGRFSGDDGIPAVLMTSGGAGVAMGGPPRGKVPTPARIEQRPHMRSPAPGARAMQTPAPGQNLAPKPPPPQPQRPAAPSPAPPPTRPITPIRKAPQPPPSATGTTVPAQPRAIAGDAAQKTLVSKPAGAQALGSQAAHAAALASTPATQPSIDPLGDTFIGAEGAGKAPARSGGPGDDLCELLHKAQTIGAVLSFADQPATMCLLIRATVYRAILDHDTQVPNAVALLFHETAAQTKEIFITAPGKRRGAMAIPAASPAFEIMARIVASGGNVDAGDPLAVTPITTSQDAKQHLARYVSEIDQAPSDAELRHFLALGALSELLVRTKLPAPTQERLRGILTHAKKEGPKQATVDLMMTALTRMMA